MAELPLGCKFTPTDDEILTYLDNKVNDLTQPNVKLDLVKELDLYQSCPADHQGLSKEECTYIFATRVARFDTTSRISDRKTKDGKGYWRLSAVSKKFQLGTKNTLTYYLKGANKRRKDKVTDWVMHEYALGPADPKMKVDETKVLCRIINRKQKHEVADKKQESDSSPKDGTGRDKSGVKLMMSKSSQEYEQNTGAPANEETVFTNLCTDGDESNQAYDPHENTTSTEKNGLDLSLKL